MWSHIARSAALTGIILGVSGGHADAAAIEVNVPFPFVVQQQTLPAGWYRVNRDDMDPAVVLISGEKGNHVRMFVLTMPAIGHDPAGEVAGLTFARYESGYQLADIWQADGEGREITR